MAENGRMDRQMERLEGQTDNALLWLTNIPPPSVDYK